MFYSYELLCLRKKGKYSVIWNAATGRATSRKIDVMRVNIEASCSELLEMVREPAHLKNASRRLSLYLAAKLMYGACVVYKNQVLILYEEVLNYQIKICSTSAAKIAKNMSIFQEGDQPRKRLPKRAGDKIKQPGKRRPKPAIPDPDTATEVDLSKVPLPPEIDFASLQPPAVDPRHGESSFIQLRQADLTMASEIAMEGIPLFDVANPAELAQVEEAERLLRERAVSKSSSKVEEVTNVQLSSLGQIPLETEVRLPVEDPSNQIPTTDITAEAAALAAEGQAPTSAEMQHDVPVVPGELENEPGELLNVAPIAATEEKVRVTSEKPDLRVTKPTLEADKKVVPETPPVKEVSTIPDEVAAMPASDAAPILRRRTQVPKVPEEELKRKQRGHMSRVYEEDQTEKYHIRNLLQLKHQTRKETYGDVARLIEPPEEDLLEYASKQVVQRKLLSRRPPATSTPRHPSLAPHDLTAHDSTRSSIEIMRLQDRSSIFVTPQVSLGSIAEVNESNRELVPITEKEEILELEMAGDFPNVPVVEKSLPVLREEEPPLPDMQVPLPLDQLPLLEEQLPLLEEKDKEKKQSLPEAPAPVSEFDMPMEILEEQVLMEPTVIAEETVTARVEEPLFSMQRPSLVLDEPPLATGTISPIGRRERASTKTTSPVRQVDDDASTRWENVCSDVYNRLQVLWAESSSGTTAFTVLCPYSSTPKVVAALTFNVILHFKKENILDLIQETPFGDIQVIHTERD